MAWRLFIDGAAGTTGLQIRDRLSGHSAVEVLSLPEARRKDPEARRDMLNSVDLAILCLPDAAAREAVSLIEVPDVRVIDASTAHRVAPDWVYGFPEMTEDRPNGSPRPSGSPTPDVTRPPRSLCFGP
jgi:N-acetyl-gamma-glutamyl-phosphate reductase